MSNTTAIDITGNKYGFLTAIRPIGSYKHSGIKWLWRCDCGKEISDFISKIRKGQKRSCGCMRVELRNKHEKIKHPIGEAAFYSVFSQYKDNAKRRNREFLLSKEEFRYFTKSNCYYCGQEPQQVFHRKRINGEYIYNGIDRLDNTKGYTIKNCVACCATCNRMKMALPLDEFLEKIQKIYLNRITK